MLFQIEERPSDMPVVERIWRAQGEHIGQFISEAKVTSEIVLTTYHGKTIVTVRGPETKATSR